VIAVPTADASPLSPEPKWGLSALDWHAHAINVGINHPVGVYLAYCGHLLMTVTELHDDPSTRVYLPGMC
jgi:hypothetical protein